MRVLFAGSNLSGSSPLAALARHAEVAGVIEVAQDGVDPSSGSSLIETARVLGWPFLAVGEGDPRLDGFVRALRPALIVTAGDRSILTPELARSAPLGAIRLHPGLLPRWSGASALQLAIASGERELGVTALWDDGSEAGEVLAERRCAFASHQDIADALAMLEPFAGELAGEVLALAMNGQLARAVRVARPSATIVAAHAPDARIDWTLDSEKVLNRVRAFARPFNGAFTRLDGGRLTIWRARAALPQGPGDVGTVWRTDGQRFCVNCGEGSLEVLEAQWTGRGSPRVGDSFDGLERAA